MTIRRWTECRALRATKARLAKIDALLVEIGGLWGDVDEFIVSSADHLRLVIEDFRQEIDESLAARAEERAAALAEGGQP